MTVSVSRSLPAAARAAWRRLRTMRTAIILLLLLAAGASVGSFFPQRPIDAAAVDRWVRRNESWAPLAERLGLFDVYGSWWFMALYGLLLVSLVGCLVPRYRAFARALRARPRATARLDVQQQYHQGTVALAPDAALSGAERFLKRKRFRLHRQDGVVAAEKGNWREGGSLVFHTAFLVLLLGMSIGKAFGYSAQVAVIEGERFTDTSIDYDSIETGRFFRGHEGFSVALDEFGVSWHSNGVPKRFVADVRVFEGERQTRAERIFVNSPLTYGGTRLYLLSWGWAPHVRVVQRGATLYDGPTVFLGRGGGWRGAIKAPAAKPHQLGLDLLFFADPEADGQGNIRDRGPEARNPLIVFQEYRGDLGLDRPQSVYELDPRGLAPGEFGAAALGKSFSLPDGIEVSFVGLKQYAVFQVASNPGAKLLLAAAGLILVGLIPALYSSRRRVWVRAAPHDGVARIEIAGHALQRKSAFEEEFKALVRDLDRDLHRNLQATVGASDG